MSDTPQQRDVFIASKADRHVMDWLRLMAGTRQQIAALRIINSFVKSEMTNTEAHEILKVLIGLAHLAQIRSIDTGELPKPTPPTRQALAAADRANSKHPSPVRRKAVTKPTLTIIKGGKE